MEQSKRAEEDIIPTLESLPVAVTEIFPDTAMDTTQTIAAEDDHPEGVFFVHIVVADIIRMKNNTLKNELYASSETKEF